MPLRPKNYYRPQNLDEALKLLKQPDSAPLGGGTRLLADDVTAQTLVDLQDLGLSGIAPDRQVLHIGATTTLTEIMDSTQLEGDAAEVLRQAVHAAGPNTFRNAATIGGVIGSREAQSELLALLLTLDTSLVMVDSEMPLSKYLFPEKRPTGLITTVIIPWAAGSGAIFRVARTPADMPIVAVVAWRPESGEAIRAAAVGISERPQRLPDIQPDNLEAVVNAVQQAVTHPGDFLGSQEYRQEMIGVLLRRAVQATNA